MCRSIFMQKIGNSFSSWFWPFFLFFANFSKFSQCGVPNIFSFVFHCHDGIFLSNSFLSWKKWRHRKNRAKQTILVSGVPMSGAMKTTSKRWTHFSNSELKKNGAHWNWLQNWTLCFLFSRAQKSAEDYWVL